MFEIINPEHSVKSAQMQSFFWLNTWKYGPEKTPYLDSFHIEEKMKIPSFKMKILFLCFSGTTKLAKSQQKYCS